MNALDNKVIHHKLRPQSEIGKKQQLACRVPAFGIVARISLGKAAFLRLFQGSVKAHTLRNHRIQKEIGRGIQNALDA